jgi:hypothetical protein
MQNFLINCLQFNKKDRLEATKISQHAVFNPIRQKINTMIANVLKYQNMFESNLIQSTLKGKIMN